MNKNVNLLICSLLGETFTFLNVSSKLKMHFNNFTFTNRISFLYRKPLGPDLFSKQTRSDPRRSVDRGTARIPAKICRTYKDC